jgi:uncharacterized repeat protein (TIGR03803 family)
VDTPATSAQTFNALLRFDTADGAVPTAGLIQATDGNFYGTTELGGSGAEYCGGSIEGGCGTVLKLGAEGKLTTLHSFCLQTGCPDGLRPVAGLVQAANGDFYGTTSAGGGSGCGGEGCGTIFRMALSGTLTTIYGFCAESGCPDGSSPASTLVKGADGDLYGTTQGGGTAGVGAGTVFKITPSGTLTTLHRFCTSIGDCADGAVPYASALVQAADGNFYGTTSAGGITKSVCNPNGGCGTVFSITSSGTLTTLYSFCATSGSCADGIEPLGSLIVGSDGDIYGATGQGGANKPNHGSRAGAGTIFKLTKSGTLTTLYNFCSQSGCADGDFPEGGVIQATNGSLYGTTRVGGAYCGPGGCGTIFSITPTGAFATVYNFCPQAGGCASGLAPQAPLLQGTNGKFYGTAPEGGDTGNPGVGTIFSLSVGLGQFVETQTTLGKVGSSVNILGTDLTGATSVSFNGTPAAFSVSSPALITTTVPAGATSGTVQVVTPGGALSSNVPFHVVQ